MDEKIQGWINLFKPKGISSFSAIYKIKKKFNIKKIGHAGTLDPEAEGILPIAINKTTKLWACGVRLKRLPLPEPHRLIIQTEYRMPWV